MIKAIESICEISKDEIQRRADFLILESGICIMSSNVDSIYGVKLESDSAYFNDDFFIVKNETGDFVATKQIEFRKYSDGPLETWLKPRDLT